MAACAVRCRLLEDHGQLDRLPKEDIDRLTTFAELRMAHEHFARADRQLNRGDRCNADELAFDVDFGTGVRGDAKRTLWRRDRERRDLSGLDREFRVLTVTVMRVDEPDVVLSGCEQDVAFVARADLAGAVVDLDVESERRPRGIPR